MTSKRCPSGPASTPPGRRRRCLISPGRCWKGSATRPGGAGAAASVAIVRSNAQLHDGRLRLVEPGRPSSCRCPGPEPPSGEPARGRRPVAPPPQACARHGAGRGAAGPPCTGRAGCSTFSRRSGAVPASLDGGQARGVYARRAEFGAMRQTCRGAAVVRPGPGGPGHSQHSVVRPGLDVTTRLDTPEIAPMGRHGVLPTWMHR
jgi:hypothetical protein